MSLFHGTLGATLGAMIGAAAWTALSYFTGLNLGILAPIVGGAAGFGMGMGNKGKGGVEAGVLAVVITILGVLGSRYALSELEYADFTDELATINEEDARERLSWEVMDRMEADGIELTEPGDDESFPPEVEARVDNIWGKMDAVERREFMAAMSHESRAMGEESAGLGTFIFFLLNMGIFGWVFTILAACTAYKTASTTVPTPAQAETPPLEASRAVAPPQTAPAEDSGSSYFSRLGQTEQPDPIQPKAAPNPNDQKAA